MIRTKIKKENTKSKVITKRRNRTFRPETRKAKWSRRVKAKKTYKRMNLWEKSIARAYRY